MRKVVSNSMHRMIPFLNICAWKEKTRLHTILLRVALSLTGNIMGQYLILFFQSYFIMLLMSVCLYQEREKFCFKKKEWPTVLKASR